MAFETSKQNKNKNLFTARLVSRRTGKLASWINPPEEFSLKVFGKALNMVTAQEAEEKLPKLFENQYLEVVVTDLTAEIEQIDPTEY